MIVYEFWLKDQSQLETFESMCDRFYIIGGKILRKIDEGMVKLDYHIEEDDIKVPVEGAGDPVMGSPVYGISRNYETHWVQLLVDDNTLPATIIEIETKINELKDTESFRTYTDEKHFHTPIETPKEFTLTQVLDIRSKQIDGTLRKIEPIQ